MTRNQGEIAFGRDLIEQLFPFHLFWNAEGEVLQVGMSLKKFFSCEDRPRLEDWVDLRGFHASPLDPEVVAAGRFDSVLFDIKGVDFKLQGQYVCDAGWLGFVGTPTVNSLSEMKAVGLAFRDMAVFDRLNDMLILVQTQEASLRICTS